MLNAIFTMQAAQFVDSAAPTTREFWRKRYFNATDAEASDPRRFVEVLGARNQKSAA